MAQEVNADGTPAPLAFVPAVSTKNCTDMHAWGVPSVLYSYIFKGNADEATYPVEACLPYYHQTAQIDSLQVNTSILGLGLINITGAITSAGAITAGGALCGASLCGAIKLFDIPHPTKENKRLVHGALEGPENGVYVRGRLTGNNVIELPDYWRGLVDPASITVSLTQIGSSQDLIVDKIEWGSKVVIRSGSASNIDCYYTVNATRKDIAPLEVEQDVVEGKTYPGS
jgi:hypothetical protein